MAFKTTMEVLNRSLQNRKVANELVRTTPIFLGHLGEFPCYSFQKVRSSAWKWIKYLSPTSMFLRSLINLLNCHVQMISLKIRISCFKGVLSGTNAKARDI